MRAKSILLCAGFGLLIMAVPPVEAAQYTQPHVERHPAFRKKHTDLHQVDLKPSKPVKSYRLKSNKLKPAKFTTAPLKHAKKRKPSKLPRYKSASRKIS